MNIIFMLIIFGLFLASLFLFIFFKAVNDGQFSDCDTPALRILFDDDKPSLDKSKNKNIGDLNEPK